MSHAYFFAGDAEKGIEHSLEYIEKELGLASTGNPDVVVMRYGLLSVDDAREIGDFARQAPVTGNRKALVLSADRFFHEAQNALLKLFEEPPEGTTMFLIVPTEGNILPTLRSRMTPLTVNDADNSSVRAKEFLSGTQKEREKMITSLLERAKSDKEEEKDAARAEARELITGLVTILRERKVTSEVHAFLVDLDAFAPLLHERAAPLKLIFEHLLITAKEL